MFRRRRAVLRRAATAACCAATLLGASATPFFSRPTTGALDLSSRTTETEFAADGAGAAAEDPGPFSFLATMRQLPEAVGAGVPLEITNGENVKVDPASVADLHAPPSGADADQQQETTHQAPGDEAVVEERQQAEQSDGPDQTETAHQVAPGEAAVVEDEEQQQAEQGTPLTAKTQTQTEEPVVEVANAAGGADVAPPPASGVVQQGTPGFVSAFQVA